MRADENRPAPSTSRRRTIKDPLLQIEDRHVIQRFQGGNKRPGVAQYVRSTLGMIDSDN